MKTFTIGMVASLTDPNSIHKEAFINAYELFFMSLRPECKSKVKIIWENDSATFEGGKKSAQKLLEAGVDCVIGHFASSAALGALEIYANRIPVLLPASTLDSLTSEYTNAFRLIGRDSDLVNLILCDIKNQKKNITIFLDHDNSLHGQNVVKQILLQSNNIMINDVIDDSVEYIIYSGSYHNSMHFLKQNSHVAASVILTDDAVHPNIIQDLEEKKYLDVSIYGYGPIEWIKDAEQIKNKYIDCFKKHPTTYFAETYACLEIAHELKKYYLLGQSLQVCLKEYTWNTSLGAIRFMNGESGSTNYAKWKIKDNELIAERIGSQLHY